MPISKSAITVTLNPAIDQTAEVPNLRIGEVNRVAQFQDDPGGKGVNVACFLASFGVSVTATGLLGRENSQPFERLFAERKITDKFLRVPGRTRTNIKLIDPNQGASSVTDVNFPGFIAFQDHIDQLKTSLPKLVAKHDVVVLAGSLPPGLPQECYQGLIAAIHDKGKPIVLDSSGLPLQYALEARPSAIKPNIHELSELVGRDLSSPQDIINAIEDLHHRGIQTVIVSMGAKGAIFSDGTQRCLAVPPSVDVKSTVGAGDAMVSGYVLGCLRGLPLPEIARLATACSMGALSTLGPTLPPPADIEGLLPSVTLEPC